MCKDAKKASVSISLPSGPVNLPALVFREIQLYTLLRLLIEPSAASWLISKMQLQQLPLALKIPGLSGTWVVKN